MEMLRPRVLVTPVVLALGSGGKKIKKFKAKLNYTMRPCLKNNKNLKMYRSYGKE